MKISLPFRNFPRYKIHLYHKDGTESYKRGSNVKGLVIELPDEILTAACYGLDSAQNICSAHLLNPDQLWIVYDPDELAKLLKPKKKPARKSVEKKEPEKKEPEKKEPEKPRTDGSSLPLKDQVNVDKE